jgi:hypothetical protein
MRAADGDGVETAAEPFGGVARVIERRVGGVARGQHHAADVFGAERVGGDGGHKRTVDAAGEAEKRLGEPGLAHVVAERQDHGAVVGLPRVGETGLFARERVPAVVALLEDHLEKPLLEGGHLVGELAVGVQDEARAVEDLVVLPAEEVEVDERQARLDHAGDHLGLTDIHLAPVIGGAVGHQQDLGPGFRKRFGHVVEPRVLADRHADAQGADAHGARRVARVVVALFVEDVVVGQVVFQDGRRNLTVLQDVVGVEGFPRPAAARRCRWRDRPRRPPQALPSRGARPWRRRAFSQGPEAGSPSGTSREMRSCRPPPSRALAQAARAASALAVRSPTVGLSCASHRRNRSDMGQSDLCIARCTPRDAPDIADHRVGPSPGGDAPRRLPRKALQRPGASPSFGARAALTRKRPAPRQGGARPVRKTMWGVALQAAWQ